MNQFQGMDDIVEIILTGGEFPEVGLASGFNVQRNSCCQRESLFYSPVRGTRNDLEVDIPAKALPFSQDLGNAAQ